MIKFADVSLKDAEVEVVHPKLLLTPAQMKSGKVVATLNNPK